MVNDHIGKIEGSISKYPHRIQALSCSEVDNLVVNPANDCTTQRTQSKAVKKTDDAS